MGIATGWRERLARAILSRDFDAATAELHQLKWTHPAWAVAIHRATSAVNPPAPLPQRPALVLPIEGAPAGAMLADNPADRVREADPTFQRRDRPKAA